MNTQWQWSGRAQDGPAAGVLWETTAQAEIAGMPMKMPEFWGKVCQKPEWSQPPPSSDNPT